MKILSIDVGIKNLAYCLFDTNEHKYIISDWNVTDLCENDSHKCLELNKKNIICNNTARYFKHDKYYCKIHAKNGGLKIPTNEFKYKMLNKKRLSDLKLFINEHDISCNTIATKKDLLENTIEEISKNYLDLITEKKVEEFSLINLGKILEKRMTELFDKHTINTVIIENQISPIATKMKTIQGMITQSCIIKGVDDIEFISAANKLKYFVEKGKTTYNERKKSGIEITNKLLQENNNVEEWIHTFETSKKKDDLADSFLQGIWYLINHNFVNIPIIN